MASGASEQKVVEDILEGGGYRYESNHSRNHYLSNGFVKIMLLFVTVALVCLVLSQSTYHTQFLQRSYSVSSPIDGTMQENVSSLSNENKMDWPSDFGGRQNKRPDKGKAKLGVDHNREVSQNQIWREANVIYFIDEMYKLWQQGMLLSNSFGTGQFSSLVITMQVGAPIPSHVPWTVKQLQTKARNLRADWRKYHDLLTRQTGWGIDPATGYIDAPEGAWEAFCDAHPNFDRDLITKPFHRYQQCTDMWAPMTATGRYARAARGDYDMDVDDDDSPQPTSKARATNSSGKRSRDWRDDDTTGAARKKAAVSDSIQNSMDAWSQLSQARLHRLEGEKEKVDPDVLNDVVLSFRDEIGVTACVNALDALLARREVAYLFMKWDRELQLAWLQKYASR